jgi:hypothetical protein
MAECVKIGLAQGCVWIALSSLALNPQRKGQAAGPETTPSKGVHTSQRVLVFAILF